MSTEQLAKYWPTLKNRKAYMKALADQLDDCVAKHANVRISFGLDSKAGYPSFRLTYTGPEGTDAVYDSYNDNGTPFPKGYGAVTPGHWSEPMTVGQLVGFLADHLP
jgi:hypothetical protein